MRFGKRAGRALISGALLAVVAACGSETTPARDLPLPGVIKLSDLFIGDFELVGTDGQTVRDDDFQGRIQAIYFGFASCPDVCPLALSRLNAALAELDDAERAQIAPIFITVDPERDTPETLASYLSFAPDFVGLTGSETAIDSAKVNFKVFSAKVPLPDSELDYTVDHSSLFYLIDRDGTPRLALQDHMSPGEIAVVLRRAIAWD